MAHFPQPDEATGAGGTIEGEFTDVSEQSLNGSRRRLVAAFPARWLVQAAVGFYEQFVGESSRAEARSLQAMPMLGADPQPCSANMSTLDAARTVSRRQLHRTCQAGDCLLAGFSRGSVLIDMSSSSPLGTRELGARLAERGVAMLDAPVSGGVRKAADATLSIMAGGDAHSIARCRPILEAMGRQIFLTGPLGSGHAMKAINNYVSAAGLVAAAEGVLAASASGSTRETSSTSSTRRPG